LVSKGPCPSGALLVLWGFCRVARFLKLKVVEIFIFEILKFRFKQMNTKLILTAGAFILGIIGLAFTFIPDEILKSADMPSSVLSLILIQLLGALYFGFAMLNWMAKGAIIGGIYNKPIATANLAHFFMGAAAIIKALIHNPSSAWFLWLAGSIYLFFAVSFGKIFTTHPTEVKSST